MPGKREAPFSPMVVAATERLRALTQARKDPVERELEIGRHVIAIREGLNSEAWLQWLQRAPVSSERALQALWLAKQLEVLPRLREFFPLGLPKVRAIADAGDDVIAKLKPLDPSLAAMSPREFRRHLRVLGRMLAAIRSLGEIKRTDAVSWNKVLPRIRELVGRPDPQSPQN